MEEVTYQKSPIHEGYCSKCREGARHIYSCIKFFDFVLFCDEHDEEDATKMFTKVEFKRDNIYTKNKKQ